MDKKQTIVWMILGLALILIWQPLMGRVAGALGYDLTKKPALASATMPADAPSAAGANQQAAPNDAPPSASGTQPTTTGATASSADKRQGYAIVPAASTRPAPETLRLGSGDSRDPTFAVALDVSPVGAGLNQVVLNDYRLTLRDLTPFTYEQPSALFANRTRSLAVRGVDLDGQHVDLTGATWTMASQDSDASDGSVAATFELTIARDGAPALVIDRTYTVFARTATDNGASGSLGFESRVANTFRNLTGQPISVALSYNGQGVPPSESERYVDAYYVLGTATGSAVEARGTVATSRSASNLLDVYKANGTPRYTGAMTTYFLALQRWEPVPGGNAPVDRFASIEVTPLTPDDSSATRATEVLITTKPVDVAAGATTGFASRVYFGPKKRENLQNAHYSAAWVRYDSTLLLTASWKICGICTWQWLIDILFSVLKGFHFVLRDWGLSIVGLVVIVRMILHPITKRAQLNTLKFGKLAPEMAKMKERYKGDQETLNREMMKFYRANGTTQVMGCLPMFLQMPVWIALWQAMNQTFELRQEPFFYGLTWIHDLSKPDHLLDFAAHGWPTFHLPLLSFISISGINVLPFVYGAVQFFQFKNQPKPPAMTEEQRQQQQMTQWMMLFMMPVILYPSPSGLMIYMITSFSIGIVESKIVKRQFAAMEAQAARFTVVDADAPEAKSATKVTAKRAEAVGGKKKGLWG